MSQWLTKNIDFIHYVKNSYQTIGNDGNRLGISINDSTTHGKNLSAPSNVLNAIFNLSDKYPIVARFSVTYDSLGNGPANPVINSVTTVAEALENIRIINPVTDHITVYFPANLMSKKGKLDLYDVCGRLLNSEELIINSTLLTRQINLVPGVYVIRITAGQYISTKRIVKN
jgi:hypothetical protein